MLRLVTRVIGGVVRYRLLGPLEVVGDDGREVKLGGDKERVVLATLLVSANQVVPTSRLVDAVWGQRPPVNAPNTLQAHVSRLRKRLSSVSGGSDNVVHTAPHGYSISAGADALDVSLFEHLVETEAQDAQELSSRLQEALALWRGPALADVPSDLLAGEAARLDELRLVVIERRIEADLSLGRHQQLIPELEALVHEEPLREGLRRQLMLALYRAGCQADALAEYRAARAVLADQLGIDPGADLQALELAILQQAPEIAAPAQPSRSQMVPDGPGDRERSHNLVVALTSFLGRESEMAALEALLGRHRLVTVTGPGGAGKTRVAIEIARRLIDRFKHGVWLVELAPLDDPGLVPVAAASVLGVSQLSDAPLIEVLAESAGCRDMLLVMDNCEHVIGGAAKLCDRLLRAGRGPRILATSREALGVEGEARFPLGPLAVPPSGSSVVDAGGYDSVALFLQRAELADPGFAPSADAVEAAARIVRRLDGMPLAIELAAAQLDVLGLDHLAVSLDDRFRVLVSPTRAAEPRQASLAAAVEWSFRLLDPVEQEVFKRVSVFPAPFTLDAASAAAGVEAMDVVPRLVRRSMVVGPRKGPDGGFRYVMLETLRAYAAMRLDESGDREPVTASVTAWTVREAQRIAAGFDSSTEEMAAVRWMDSEQDNLRAVLDWALVHDEHAAVSLAIALGPWWQVRSRWREAVPLLERVRTAAPDLSVEEMAAVDYWTGWLSAISGEYAGTLERLCRAADLISDRDPSRLLVDCWIAQANVLNNTGRGPEACEMAKRALQVAQAIDYPTGQTLAYLHLATAALYAEDYPAMLSWAGAAQTLPTERISGASARIRTVFLGMALEQTGNLDQAKQAYVDGLKLARGVGDSVVECFQQLGLARIAMSTGRSSEATANLDAALHLAHKSGSWLQLFDALQTTAALIAESAPEDALTLFGAGQALRRWHNFSFDENVSDEDFHKQPLDRARRKLGAERTRAAESRGAGMTVGAAVEYALARLHVFVATAGLSSA